MFETEPESWTRNAEGNDGRNRALQLILGHSLASAGVRSRSKGRRFSLDC